MADPFSLDTLRDIPDPAGSAGGAPKADPPMGGDARVLADLGPSLTRAERRRRIAVAAVAGCAWVGAVLAVAGVRSDVTSLAVVGPIVALACLAAVVGTLSLGRRAGGLPADVRFVHHALWVIPSAYVGLVALISAPRGVGLCMTTHGACIALSSALALGAGFVATFALRRSFTSAPIRRGAVAGALVGLAGSAFVHAHCPAQNLEHLLVGHGAVIALFALAGAAFGARGGRP